MNGPVLILVLHLCALAGYLGSAAILGAALGRGQRAAPLAAPALAFAAVLAHAAGLGVYTARHQELPLVGLGPSLSTLGFAVGVLLLAAERPRNVRPLGLILLPLAGLLVGAALLFGLRPAGEPLAFRGPWFVLHVLLAFLGYAGLAGAFAAGVLYLLQLRELRVKRFGRMFRFFPSLDALERAGRTALSVGFPALTLALVLGWAWTVRFRNSLEVADPKVLWAVFSWLVMGLALAFRGGGPRRQRWGALVTVVGFLLVVAAYVVLRTAIPHAGKFF